MSKMKVAVVTDSTCNLPPEYVEEHNIFVIPQIVNWDGESLLDGIDLVSGAFYERLASSPTLPTTSQPSAGEFLEFFKNVAEEAESIVAVLISDELSGTLDSARTAASMMPDYSIEIVDSRSASMGLGLMALATAEAVQQGMNNKEAAEVARAMVPDMRIIFVVDTLEYLHKGGRIGGARRLIGSMLSMKPLLHLVDGRIEPLVNVRTKKKAIAHLLNVVREDTSGLSSIQAAVINAVSPQEGQEIYDAVAADIKPEKLIKAELSPVIGTHVGPGTVGIVYYAKRG
jgi:DegV family protein with EDD domain